MSYDILYAGELKPGADPGQVRTNLQAAFRLSDEVAARLFSGQTLALKRGLDLAQAQRLRQVFLEAGAVAWLVEQPAPAPGASAAVRPGLSLPEDRLGAGAGTLAPAQGTPALSSPGPTSPLPADNRQSPSGSTALPGSASVDHWTLAPAADDQPLETATDHPPLVVDISRLHIVTGQDWSLADCDRPPALYAMPDISHLRILEPEQE